MRKHPFSDHFWACCNALDLERHNPLDLGKTRQTSTEAFLKLGHTTSYEAQHWSREALEYHGVPQQGTLPCHERSRGPRRSGQGVSAVWSNSAATSAAGRGELDDLSDL